MDKLVTQSAQRSHTILIVDDEHQVCSLIEDMLNTLDCTIYYAENARNAFEIFNTEQIELIILDALLPDMHGFKAATAIRKLDRGKNTPILMISGVYTKMKYQYHAKEFGINAYLTKPFSMDELLMAVRKLLKIKTC